MALLDYFKKRAKFSVPAILLNKNGPLCKAVPSSSIREANLCITQSLQTVEKCKPYVRVSDDQKAAIAKYALEHGIVNAMTHFAPDFPKGSLKKSTVHGWKKAYLLELRTQKKSGGDLKVKSLPCAKMGRPLTLGPVLDKRQVQAYLLATREKAGAVTSNLVIAAAEGIVIKKDSKLLAVNGGHISLTRDWARSLLDRMGFVRRKANTKAKVPVVDLKN